MRPILCVVVITMGLVSSGCGSAGTTSETSPVPPAVPPEFAPLCTQSQVTCNADVAPPSLVGSYTGQGKTLVTSNELWHVGDASTFKVQITSQVDGQGAGSIDMGSFHLDVEQAKIRGDAHHFTIYGVDSAAQDGCTAEAQGIISGDVADANAAQLSGQLVLVFTKNIQGQGCKQSQIDGYPGTGATFSYSATRAP